MSREQARLERQLEQLAGRIEDIDADLGEPDVHRRPDELKRLVAERRRTAEEVERAEAAWLAVQGEIDRIAGAT